MKIIRRSAFETNSSSSHSIVYDKSVKTYSSITPDGDGYIVLTGGEFGWNWRRITDPLEKANYYAIDNQHSEDRIDVLKEVIREHTGAKDVVISINSDYRLPNWSYIDHQSCGTTSDITFKDEIKEFIFGGGILFTGNDNGSPPPNFLDEPGKQYNYTISYNGRSIHLTEAEMESLKKCDREERDWGDSSYEIQSCIIEHVIDGRDFKNEYKINFETGEIKSRKYTWDEPEKEFEYYGTLSITPCQVSKR